MESRYATADLAERRFQDYAIHRPLPSTLELAQTQTPGSYDKVRPSAYRIVQKVRWIWRDKAKTQVLVQQLGKKNQDLWQCLPPRHTLTIDRGLPTFVLTNTNDLNDLETIERIARGNHAGASLASCAELRRSLLEINDNTSQEWRDRIPLLRPQDIIDQLIDSDTSIQANVGTLAGHLVVVEYRTIDINLSDIEREIARTRGFSIWPIFFLRNASPNFAFFKHAAL